MRARNRIKPFMKWLEKKWLESPDLRFGQLVINLGIVEDSIRTWSAELSDYPIPHEHMREIQTWGSRGKGGRGKLKNIKIKDLETEHIKNILKTQIHIKNTPIEKILKEELKYRKNG